MPVSVSVIGLGQIGITLAMSFCENGFKVIGIDTDVQKVEGLQQGYVTECYGGLRLSHLLTKHLSSKNFKVSNRVAVAAWETDAYVVTVGARTPAGQEGNDPDLLSALEQLGRVIKPNDLVLLYHAVYRGMMEEKLISTLERASYMTAGIDFHVAHAKDLAVEGLEAGQPGTLVIAAQTAACAHKAHQLLEPLAVGHLDIAAFAKMVDHPPASQKMSLHGDA